MTADEKFFLVTVTVILTIIVGCTVGVRAGGNSDSTTEPPITGPVVPSNETGSGAFWVETLPELLAAFPLPTYCQTSEDVGFIVYEDGSVKVADDEGCVFDPDTMKWRHPNEKWRRK